MNIRNTVLSQLIEHLPLYQFPRCVGRYDGSLDQYLYLFFSQLTYLESLGDITPYLLWVCKTCYIKIARTTIADTNETRNRRISQDVVHILIYQAKEIYSNDPFVISFYGKTVRP
jgi:hypothetical protein